VNKTTGGIYLKKNLAFILMGVVGFWMLATEAALSYPNAKDWGNAFKNSDLLALEIHLGNQCITNSRDYGNPKKISFPVEKAKIKGIGTVVVPLTYSPTGTTVGVHIIPYVINPKNIALYLIPGVQNLRKNPFRKFYRTCLKEYNYQLAPKYLKYYPVVLLRVESEDNRKQLEQRLKKQQWWGQDNSSSVDTLGKLLSKIFKKKPQFLKDLRFDVHVELIDESKKQSNPLTFCVPKKGSSRCKFSRAKAPKPTNNGGNNCNNEALNTRIADADKEIKRLRDELQKKSGEVITLNESLGRTQLARNKAEFELSSCQDSYQQSSRGVESEIQRLTLQLEAAQLAKQQLAASREKNQKLNDQITQLNKQLAEEIKDRRVEPPKPLGNHRLIIVSLSKLFAQRRNRQDHVIRESLIKVFSDLKRKGNRVPFTLLTIQAGRLLNESLLTYQDVQRLPVKSKHKTSIRSKVEYGLQFGATDLRPLDDLGLVDAIIYEKKVGQVLYLTDNARMGDKPPNRQRGIPLAWREDGVRLHVLTNKPNGCQAWEYVGANCKKWQSTATLKTELTKFLQ
jgi:hypothetical protein